LPIAATRDDPNLALCREDDDLAGQPFEFRTRRPKRVAGDDMNGETGRQQRQVHSDTRHQYTVGGQRSVEVANELRQSEPSESGDRDIDHGRLRVKSGVAMSCR
jgi:hypothetical protein